MGTGDAPKNWRAYKEIKESTTTPINTGEAFSAWRRLPSLIENTPWT